MNNEINMTKKATTKELIATNNMISIAIGVCLMLVMQGIMLINSLTIIVALIGLIIASYGFNKIHKSISADLDKKE